MTRPTTMPGYAGHLKATAPTIAEGLQASGYHTAMFGKWHVSNTVERPEHMQDLNRQRFPQVFSPIEQYPSRRGFETYYGTIWGVVNYFNPFSLVDGETPVKELSKDFYITDAINERAAAYGRSQAGSDTPFFISVAPNARPWPLPARAADVARSRDL